jgi:glycosyltransferase involved in cell wall biosynthesis
MRVVWVNRSEWRKPGPIVYVGLLNASSFARLDVPVDFFCSEGPDSETADDMADFYGIGPVDGLAIHRVSRGSKFSELRGRLVYRQAIEHAKRLLKAGEEVLFLTRELGLTPLLAGLQWRFGDRLRTVYEAHDFHASLEHRESIDFNDRRRQLTERFALPRLSGVVTITSEQAKLYSQAFPSTRILNEPLGCLEFPRETSAAELFERRTIAYIGHLHRQKGVPQLLKHEKVLSEKGIKLEIIGGDSSRAKQLRGKRKLAGESPIQILPSMPPARLHEHLATQVGAGLVPLEDNFYNRNLTCPVKALDSIAHHLPVVASDLPSTREVLGEGGVYVAPGDGEALVRAIAELFSDADRFTALSAAASQRAAELAWEPRARRILDWTWSR